MKMLPWHSAAIKKANHVPEIPEKGTENKTESVIMPLHKHMVFPHLDTCVQCCSSHRNQRVQQSGMTEQVRHRCPEKRWLSEDAIKDCKSIHEK